MLQQDKYYGIYRIWNGLCYINDITFLMILKCNDATNCGSYGLEKKGSVVEKLGKGGRGEWRNDGIERWKGGVGEGRGGDMKWEFGKTIMT